MQQIQLVAQLVNHRQIGTPDSGVGDVAPLYVRMLRCHGQVHARIALLQLFHGGDHILDHRGTVHDAGTGFQIDVDAIEAVLVEHGRGTVDEVADIFCAIQGHGTVLTAEGDNHDFARCTLGGDVGNELLLVEPRVEIESHAAIAGIVGKGHNDHIPHIGDFTDAHQTGAVVEVMPVTYQCMLRQQTAVAPGRTTARGAAGGARGARAAAAGRTAGRGTTAVAGEAPGILPVHANTRLVGPGCG